jgi:ribosome-associated toxin RatA of RatAB toxin-antitoxin module
MAMSIIKKEAYVPYTTAEMYALVNGIEDYSQFLPWCKSTTVHSRTEVEVKASIQVRKGQIEQSFTTLNRLQPNQLIEVRLLEGPFKYLEGSWRFEEEAGGGSKVSLDLSFEFSNRLVAFTVGPLLNTMANTFIDAFSERAKVIYGNSSNDL